MVIFFFLFFISSLSCFFDLSVSSFPCASLSLSLSETYYVLNFSLSCTYVSKTKFPLNIFHLLNPSFIDFTASVLIFSYSCIQCLFLHVLLVFRSAFVFILVIFSALCFLTMLGSRRVYMRLIVFTWSINCLCKRFPSLVSLYLILLLLLLLLLLFLFLFLVFYIFFFIYIFFFLFFFYIFYFFLTPFPYCLFKSFPSIFSSTTSSFSSILSCFLTVPHFSCRLSHSLSISFFSSSLSPVQHSFPFNPFLHCSGNYSSSIIFFFLSSIFFYTVSSLLFLFFCIF